MLDWFIQNKTWLFSGIAASVPIALAGWLLSKKRNGGNSGINDSTVQCTQGEKSPAVNTNKGDVEIRYGK